MNKESIIDLTADKYFYVVCSPREVSADNSANLEAVVKVPSNRASMAFSYAYIELHRRFAEHCYMYWPSSGRFIISTFIEISKSDAEALIGRGVFSTFKI